MVPAGGGGKCQRGAPRRYWAWHERAALGARAWATRLAKETAGLGARCHVPTARGREQRTFKSGALLLALPPVFLRHLGRVPVGLALLRIHIVVHGPVYVVICLEEQLLRPLLGHGSPINLFRRLRRAWRTELVGATGRPRTGRMCTGRPCGARRQRKARGSVRGRPCLHQLSVRHLRLLNRGRCSLGLLSLVEPVLKGLSATHGQQRQTIGGGGAGRGSLGRPNARTPLAPCARADGCDARLRDCCDHPAPGARAPPCTQRNRGIAQLCPRFLGRPRPPARHQRPSATRGSAYAEATPRAQQAQAAQRCMCPAGATSNLWSHRSSPLTGS